MSLLANLPWIRRGAIEDGPRSDSDHELRLARATQEVRVRQSQRTLPMVFVTGVVLLVTLWNDAPRAALAGWIGLVLTAALVRTLFCQHIAPRLEAATREELERFERYIFWTAICNSSLIGSGFWWVGLQGTERAIFAVTLVACLYAVGSMINASVQFAGFAWFVGLNLGQGILFFSGIGGRWEPVVAIPLICILLLLISFGRENARQFAESIRIRAENLRLVDSLNAEKRAVEAALASAREANEAKSQFLAAASHDLRQPLHALSLFLGSLSLLIEGDEAKRLMGRVSETTRVLQEQFNGLLDLSRFDAGGVQAEPADFRIDSLLERLSREVRPDAVRKGLVLELSAPPLTVRSDPLLVEQVVRNLLANAVHYTAEGTVSITAEPDGELVRVAVADTGPGISEENQGRVFEDFVQLSNPARRREQGFGLGLAIVRRIERLLGLNLELRSAPERGSRFEFRLPMVATARDEPVSSVAEESESAVDGLRVWAVEDDPVVGEALAGQLASWGCSARVAGSRRELEATFEEAGAWPDCVLVDDMLGREETGLDLARWLSRSMPRKRIVMMTGNTDPARLAEMRASGFRVLLKPTRAEHLLEILSGLGKRRDGGDGVAH